MTLSLGLVYDHVPINEAERETGAMPGRKITEEQLEKACELREGKGLSTRQIIIRLGLGISDGALDWHFLIRGVESPNMIFRPKQIYRDEGRVIERSGHKVRRFTREEDAKITAMSKRGCRPCEIARALGRRHNSVMGRLATIARHEERKLAAMSQAAD